MSNIHAMVNSKEYQKLSMEQKFGVLEEYIRSAAALMGVLIPKSTFGARSPFTSLPEKRKSEIVDSLAMQCMAIDEAVCDVQQKNPKIRTVFKPSLEH